jgi:CGNR zinc finger protein
MARGQYKQTRERRALQALVAFAEDPKARPIDLARAGRAYVLPGAAEAIRTLSSSPSASAKAREALRQFLRDMAFAGPLAPATAHAEHRLSVDLVMAGGPSGVIVFIEGNPIDVLKYQTYTFLQAIGTANLRRCPAPDCLRAFVKRGRREYCSPRCQRRVFLKSYNPFQAQPRRKDRGHGKKR